MVLKSFSHISRHAALAKSLWVASSGTSSQPTLISKSNYHLARHQQNKQHKQHPPPPPSNSQHAHKHSSQHTSGNGNGNGNSSSSSSSSHPTGTTTRYSSNLAIHNSTSFSTLSPLATLDEDKRRDAILAESTGSNGLYLAHNHQHSLVSSRSYLVAEPVLRKHNRRRRCSTSSLDSDTNTRNPAMLVAVPGRVRRYSVSHADLPTHADNAQKKQAQPKTPPPSPSLGPINASNQLIEAELDLLHLETESIITQQASAAAQDQIDTESSLLSSPLSSPRSTSTHTSYTLTDQLDSAPTSQAQQHSLLTSQLHESLATSSIPSVLASYQLLVSHNVPLTTEIYQSVLSFLSANILSNNTSQNLSSLLSIYMDAVSKSTPTRAIYASVIDGLATLAQHTETAKEGSVAYKRLAQRHPRFALPSVLASLRNGDSSVSLYKAALDIFNASNSVKTQKFQPELYAKIVKAILATGDHAMLGPLIKMLDSNRTMLTAEVMALIIKAFGHKGDIKAAVETYKHYLAISANLVEQQQFQVYSALIGAYFDTANPQSAHVFLNKIVALQHEPADLAPAVDAVVEGYCRIGDYSSAMAWMAKIEHNPDFPAVSSAALETVLTAACDAGDLDTSTALYKLMQNSKSLSNVARSDFVTLCVKTNAPHPFMDAVHESSLNNGVWDLSTVFVAVRYFIQLGEVSLALRTLDNQSKLYSQFMTESKLDMENQSVDLVNRVVQELQVSGNLTVRAALSMMETEFFDSKVFSDVNGGGIGCITAIWDSLASGELDNQVLADSPNTIVAIVDAHLRWIQASGANNSLGGLSISVPLLNSLSTNFGQLVTRLIAIAPPMEPSFEEDVALALSVLGETNVAAAWTQFCEEQNAPPASLDAADFVPVSWNLPLSHQIISTPNFHEALDMFTSAVDAGIYVTAEAHIRLINDAAKMKQAGIIKDIYKQALALLPCPSNLTDSIDAWIPIHGAVVKTANLSYPVAEAAYKHLLELNSSPDADGYAQLIACAPATTPVEEAADAIWMFDEAKNANIVLNTLLYNALLAKLGKANMFKDAVSVFNRMDLTNISKNPVTYSTMIQAACKCGNEDAANAFLTEMESSNTYRPSVTPFNILLEYYVHTKRDRDSALDIVSRIQSLGMVPSGYTYKLLIEAYGTIEPVNVTAANKVLIQIAADGVSISTQHFAALIFSLGVVLRNTGAALQFYFEVLRSGQVRPDKYIFQALLESYVYNNEVRATKDVLNYMVTHGVDLDVHMADVLIRGWATADMTKATNLFQHVLAEGMAQPSSFESMALAHLYNNDISAAYGLLDLMATRNYSDQAIARLQTLIEAHSLPETKVTTTVLFSNIYKHTRTSRGSPNNSPQTTADTFATSPTDTYQPAMGY